MKIKQICLLVCGAGVLLSGLTSCATDAPYRVEEKITSQYVSSGEMQANDDQALADRLNSIISKEFKNTAVKAFVRFDNVLLVGQVVNNADKLRIADVCKKWPGTKKIFDYITIVPQQPVLNISSSLASKSMDLIKIHFDINPDNIKLVANDGIIYIMGTNIGNLSAYKTAMDNMYSVEGVHKVINLEQVGNMDYHTDTFK